MLVSCAGGSHEATKAASAQAIAAKKPGNAKLAAAATAAVAAEKVASARRTAVIMIPFIPLPASFNMVLNFFWMLLVRCARVVGSRRG